MIQKALNKWVRNPERAVGRGEEVCQAAKAGVTWERGSSGTAVGEPGGTGMGSGDSKVRFTSSLRHIPRQGSDIVQTVETRRPLVRTAQRNGCARVCVHVRVRILGESTEGVAGLCSPMAEASEGDGRLQAGNPQAPSLTCLVGDAGYGLSLSWDQWPEHLRAASWLLRRGWLRAKGPGDHAQGKLYARL